MPIILKPNTAEFATKIVDGEAILINLSNGMYYSMDMVGGFVWELIEAGHDIDSIIEAVTKCYDASEAMVKQDIEQLIQQLVEENIVVFVEGAPLPAPAMSRDISSPQRYATPQIEKFDDMVDLFALDPPLPELSKLNESK